MFLQPQPLANYGAFTAFSKALNQALGDTTGRSVSTRTAHGFIKLFKTQELGADGAELIVHSGMVAAGALLKSKDEGAQITGIALSLGLFICYHAGK